MNLSRENMAHIRAQVMAGVTLDPSAVEDLQGHNDHLIELCEAKGRLLLRAEVELENIKLEMEQYESELAKEKSISRGWFANWSAAIKQLRKARASVDPSCSGKALRVEIDDFLASHSAAPEGVQP